MSKQNKSRTTSEFSAMRITRAALKSEVAEFSSSRVTRNNGKKKKVQFDDLSIIKERSNKNHSLVSDEGIDMNYSPFLPSLGIYSAVIKAQHPLPNSWTFWYSVGDKKLSWKQNQIKISTVTTIEEFWHTYTQVQPASCLPAGYTYSVFRAGIIPDWEDRQNKNGGRWMVECAKTDRQEQLDSRWMEILFMLMGEHVEGTRLVTGAEVCVRKKGDRLEVWMGEVNIMRRVVEVGREVKRKLMLGSGSKIHFSIHEEEREGTVGPCLVL